MRSFLRLQDSPSKWSTMAAACLGLGMLMVNTFVVNVALPAMARDLDVDLGTAQWIVSAFVLTLGVLPIAAGRLADILGRRQVYLAGLVIFLAGSLGCALANDVYALILFRVVQGVGGAAMQPASLSIVISAFPPQERGLAVGIWGGVSGLGLILGPILGGLLVLGGEWRPVFLVNVPVGVAALLMALRYVPRSRDESASRSIDWPAVALLSGGLFLVMFGVTRANAEGWTSTLVLGCFASGAGLISAFIRVEQKTKAPLVDLSLFRSATFLMACLSAFLFSATVFGSQPYTSLFVQNFWGYSPLEGGLAFLPSTVLVALFMPFSGVLAQRLGRHLRLIVIAGSGMVAVSFAYLLWLDTGDGYVSGLLPAFVVRGAGIGLVMTSTSLAVVSAVPLAKSGLASGTLTMARNVGTSMGIAILGAAYLRFVDTEAASRFAGGDAEQLPFVSVAARRFAAAGEGSVRLASEQLVVDGYIVVSAVCVAMALVATVTAFFIRHQAAVRPVPAPAGATARPAPALAAEGD